MATTTTLITVKQAVVSTLEAALADVQVSYFHPGEDRKKPESIWLGSATADVDITSLKAGRKKRDEDITVQVIVEVVGNNLTQESTDTRAVELLEAVDDALADDPQLGLGGTIHWAVMSRWEQFVGSTDRGHACRFEIDVTVKARLS